MVFPHLPVIMYSHKYQPDLPVSRKIGEPHIFGRTPEIGEIMASADFWLACISVDMILGTDLRKKKKKPSGGG